MVGSIIRIHCIVDEKQRVYEKCHHKIKKFRESNDSLKKY